MPDKQVTIQREGGVLGTGGSRVRPIMLAMAGDSGTGKTTITAGLVEALGPERITSVGADDYHRYDREERKEACPGLGTANLRPRLDVLRVNVAMFAAHNLRFCGLSAGRDGQVVVERADAG